ncbi:MAG: polyprenyl synthetase family protein, partial [Pseudomonadota bacterium]
ALFAAATHTGAIIASAPQREEVAMEAFGRDFGIAYQLVDDALDYTGFEGKLGKTVGDDFREGKMTLPVILSVASADAEERQFWQRTIADGQQADEDFAVACEIMVRHDAVGKTLALAGQYADKAIANLSSVPATEDTEALRTLVQTSLSRAN